MLKFVEYPKRIPTSWMPLLPTAPFSVPNEHEKPI